MLEYEAMKILKSKILYLSIFLFLFFLIAILLTLFNLKNNKKNIIDESTSLAPVDDYWAEYSACEKTFDEPIDVTWEGEVIALLVSGVDYGIKKIPEDAEYPYFYAGRTEEEFDRVWEAKKEVGLQGNVRVKGKWVGITSAYRNSIFGRCVPHVMIESIENI